MCFCFINIEVLLHCWRCHIIIFCVIFIFFFVKCQKTWRNYLRSAITHSYQNVLPCRKIEILAAIPYSVWWKLLWAKKIIILRAFQLLTSLVSVTDVTFTSDHSATTSNVYKLFENDVFRTTYCECWFSKGQYICSTKCVLISMYSWTDRFVHFACQMQLCLPIVYEITNGCYDISF